MRCVSCLLGVADKSSSPATAAKAKAKVKVCRDEQRASMHIRAHMSTHAHTMLQSPAKPKPMGGFLRMFKMGSSITHTGADTSR